MDSFQRNVAALIVIGVIASLALAQAPRRATVADPKAAELEQQMEEAYAKLSTYQATVSMSIRTQQGRWTSTQSADYMVAFDRKAQQLRLDRPELLLVSDGAKLRIKSDHFPGRYVEINAPKTIDYAALLGVAPFLDQPPMPETVPLLSIDPISQFAGGEAQSTFVAPDPVDAMGRPGLRFPTNAGTMTLLLDPQTHLVSAATLALTDAGAGGSAVIEYQVKDLSIDAPIDAKTFAFDTTNATAVASLNELAGGGGGGGEQADASPQNPKDAPPITLPFLDGGNYDSKDESAKVVVLDFWATWCPPCRKGLPKIQELHDWVKTEKLPVAVYTVNLGEQADQVRKFVEQQKLTVPVLLDSQSKTGDAFGVQAIPYTVVIAGGKIVNVHPGYRDDIADVLKKQVNEALAAQPQ